MRLFYTTSEFVYKGKECPGIPFLCTDDMDFIPVVNDYLLWLSLENANTESSATWKSHAEALYDYFSWLIANDLEWDEIPQNGNQIETISNIAMYRNWSLDLVDLKTGERQIQASTIRKRLSQIMSFYRWALRRKRIAFLPWDEAKRVVLIPESVPSMYRHMHAPRAIAKDNLRPKVRKKLIPFLQLDQCRMLMRCCRTETLQLMTKLMLQSGLRNEECRTFPRQYVFDPSAQDSLRRIAINLSPNNMALKGNKSRRIYISWQLMKELFDYLNFGEGSQRANLYRKLTGNKSPNVFLNNNGEPWSEKGLNNAYRKLWTPLNKNAPLLGFRVTPHMLRHTFATLELFAESQRRNLGEALAWVRDRLGHSSIATTTIYVHCLDMMGEFDLNTYQKEIDALLIGK